MILAAQLSSTEDRLYMWPLETAGSLDVKLTYRLTDRLVQWTIAADVPRCAVPRPFQASVFHQLACWLSVQCSDN